MPGTPKKIEHEEIRDIHAFNPTTKFMHLAPAPVGAFFWEAAGAVVFIVEYFIEQLNNVPNMVYKLSLPKSFIGNPKILMAYIRMGSEKIRLRMWGMVNSYRHEKKMGSLNQ
ncbi:MAG: hypothetical protein JXB25_05910 [Deltaproteobacteria bacterium]|nr:hypothetical protein [Deltaproteobacteria bacterium]